MQDGISKSQFATVKLCAKVRNKIIMQGIIRLSQLCLLEFQAFLHIMQCRLRNSFRSYWHFEGF